SVFKALGSENVEEGSKHVTAGVIRDFLTRLHTERVFNLTVFGIFVKVLSGEIGKIFEFRKGENR
ncbi:MAG: hypothetical protein ACK56F_18090, partial [bacterium]